MSSTTDPTEANLSNGDSNQQDHHNVKARIGQAGVASKGLNQGVPCSDSQLLKCQLSTRSQIVLNPIPLLRQRTCTRIFALHLTANTAHIMGTISLKLQMYYKPMYAYFPAQLHYNLVRNEQTQPLQQMPLNDSRQLLT